ncbi:hypothetical protein EV361DRAFT_638141 [Lentinula raphanica]|nr:hypothetical protein FB446DRAFT_29274 [Lentinula raphanica]KAJ3974495.1 hypothetical protein EV361DRAFT_638141 [Lentinula raphanica]
MKFGKPKLPLDWPSPLHNKCSKASCFYPNLPQPAPGTYICVGCGKGSYVVTLEMAAEADAQCRRAFEFQDQKRRKYQAIQATNEKLSKKRDYARYGREMKTEERREKWNERPGSPLERRPATKRPGSPVARAPLQTTPALLQAPALIKPSKPSAKIEDKTSEFPQPPRKPITYVIRPSQSTPPRCLSPKNVLMKCASLARKTPERVYNPNTYNPNWAEDADRLLRGEIPRDNRPTPVPIQSPSPPRPHKHDPYLCARVCPIHSKPKGPMSNPASSAPTRPAIPVRPPRPPTISLSIHSKPSREEIPVAVVNDAEYYASKARLQMRGYMPPIVGQTSRF